MITVILKEKRWSEPAHNASREEDKEFQIHIMVDFFSKCQINYTKTIVFNGQSLFQALG